MIFRTIFLLAVASTVAFTLGNNPVAVAAAATAGNNSNPDDNDNDNNNNIINGGGFLRGGGRDPSFLRTLQQTPTGETDICTDTTLSQKFTNVPSGRSRSLTNTCPGGQILLGFDCIVGGRGRTAVVGTGCGGAACGFDLGEGDDVIFREDIGQTSFVESLVDGRRVAIGATCVMINGNSITFGRDATLENKITCGDPDAFPDVELVKKSEFKSKVPSNKNRDLFSSCPEGKEILGSTCAVGGGGSFKFRSGSVSETELRCTFKNTAGGKRSATYTNSMICGSPTNAPEDVCVF
mmetsp:Transcript_28837/g.69786  ORF Transcript_28837/g.69786 Transcript_28837/m.69786 type:complete len:294 (+) Transcript_28837:392-1273(+)|eukprot:CAMPEP_0113477184 /NCGR_PEP_ID=MMETSP0014_2-20120614/20071_1 /TAXON_ID=2857 /ORGANISM="Nitzschia sp." /LENGTH=293 /DNA_ID=CAMNT_0000370259 /DNA_START=323 /DNA_END=1204 /DNA_ORIENTATION=- /assembly_acc=CAM_ASM_000159